MKQAPIFPALAALLLALLVAAAALGGIVFPSTYALETPSWAAQGIGQDWVNLVLVAPFLVITGLLARQGSRAALLLLGGALLYCVYSFAIYAFAVHFNRLFLVYCAALGLSLFAFASLMGRVMAGDPANWFEPEVPVLPAGSFQIAVALLFAGLWLAEDVPALIKGAPPASLAEVGLVTNPVHVLDLSSILPAFVLAGVSLLRRHALGYFLSPVMLTFGILMAAAIGGMVMMMRQRGVAVPLALPAALGALVLLSGALLTQLLGRMRGA